jgi:high-affinity nickel permease
MSTLLTIIILGLFLGMRHATDPDHVVAVTTIVSRERRVSHAMAVGALWGLGHTATIFIVGSAIILLKITIPPAVGLTMELSVGLMLIFLGVLNLTGLLSRAIEWLARHGYLLGAHTHILFGRQFLHAHSGDDSSYVARRLPSWGRKLGLFHILRPMIVGIVHGLAGSAAVTLLVLATITRPGWTIAYLLVFGVGTIIGMLLITAAVALPFTCTLKRFARINHALATASGLMSVCFGIFLCYQIGIVNGLFTGHPAWSPR